MDQKNDILNYLKLDEADNINIINFIEGYNVNNIERIGDSVLAKGTSDRNWVYISCKCQEELEMIKDRLDSGDKCFAVVEDWMVPILVCGKNIKWKLSTMRLIMPHSVSLPVPVREISDLTTQDSDFIYESSDYKEFLSIEYIRERIMNGISSCIRVDNELTAWAITQDDGAIGFLHVLAQHWKKGYGRDITLDMINKVRAHGKIPFVHIEEKNEKSMGLALGLGFKKDRIVNWLEVC